MDGNVELLVNMTCIIGTYQTRYTIIRHIKQENTTSVTGGTLIFNLFSAKYHRRSWHGITPPPFFFFKLSVHTQLFSIKNSLLFHFFFLNLPCSCPYSYSLMLTTTYVYRPYIYLLRINTMYVNRKFKKKRGVVFRVTSACAKCYLKIVIS